MAGLGGGGWNTFGIPECRWCDRERDILTGTPEADIFELDAPGFATQSLDDNFIAMDIDFENNLIVMGRDFKNDFFLSNPNTVDASEGSPVDLLVYQEADGPEYFPGFTDPLARSYTLIENFDPVEDQILVDGGKGYVRIMSGENDIPMLTDDVQPTFVYDPFNPIVAFGE